MRLPAFFLLAALLLGFGTTWAQHAPVTKPKASARKAAGSRVRPARQPAKAKAAGKAEAAVIVFTKTPCYGTCPHYEATIYPSGRVTYTGYSYVKLKGPHELRLPAATVATMLAEARHLNFAQLADVYTKGATDTPATSLSIRQPDGQLKTVRAEQGTPADLQHLLDYISGELDRISGGSSDSQ